MSGPGIKLIFELTNGCELSCLHCFREPGQPARFLPVAILERVLDQVAGYEVDMVALTGGEPTLHPEFETILAVVREHRYRLSIVSNGWNFQPAMAKLEPYLDSLANVSLSLDGAREQTHDALRRPGSYRRVMQALSSCKFHGINFHLNMVVSRTNRGELGEMALLASGLGCAALGFAHCQPTPQGVAADLVLDVTGRREVETEIAELQSIFRLPILLAGDHYECSLFHLCPQLVMSEFNIDYRGNLTACCALSGYRGGTPDTEVIADLGQVGFPDAHRRLLTRIATLIAEKISWVAAGERSAGDHFICSHCLQHFAKLAPAEVER